MFDSPSRAHGWRVGLLSLTVLIVMMVLINRLWSLEITNADNAQAQIEEQTQVRSRIAPARGAIRDRTGLPLAENRPSFDIDLYLEDLVRNYKQTNKGRFPIYTYPKHKDGKLLPGETGSAGNDFRRHKHVDGLVDLNLPNQIYEPDIVEIVKQSLGPILLNLGIDRPITEKDEKDIREHYRTDRDLPYHFITDLDFTTVAQFAERNTGASGVSGVVLSQNPVRNYTYGSLAAHIMGYVGKPDNQEDAIDDQTDLPYDTVGRHGIEHYWDDMLQGHAGFKVQRVSSQGYVIEDEKHPIPTVEPTVGDSVYLTLDAHIQSIVENTLRTAGVGRAAVVVMDPNNGDVLALASVPNFDPNNFIPKIDSKTWDQLIKDPTAPMYNRALHGMNPGSTYKIMVALAGLRSGKVDANTLIDCPGAIQIDDHLFHNSDSTDAGQMALQQAICVSSDVFFYQWGIKTGVRAIDDLGARVGFGQKWNLLGEDEDAGILPSPESFLKRHHFNWSNAQTANISIGQGDVLCTPLQMATFLCAVANGGNVYYPRLYTRVVDDNGNWVNDTRLPQAGRVFNTLDCRPEDLAVVRDGMRDVVDHGTATKAQIAGITVAGKTGTAQAYIKGHKDLKGWFYCFAPFDHPRYVVCVMVEGITTWGGSVSAPIAQRILTKIFQMENGQMEPLTYLQPIKGNFDGIASVDPIDSTGVIKAAEIVPGTISTAIDPGNIPTAPAATSVDSPMGTTDESTVTNPEQATPEASETIFDKSGTKHAR